MNGETITTREREVLELLRSRRTNAEIADQLFISVRTVESHVSSMITKLEAKDRHELAELADEFVLPRRTNLPTPATSLRGRATDIEQVTDLFHRSKLVTLTGPGGVGKTRLALEVAARAGDVARDGTWFIDLTTVERGEDIGTHILQTMGAPAVLLDTPLESLATYLDPVTCLLIFDNCEHVQDESSRTAARIVQRQDGVTILATSRHSLGAPAEVVYEVEPLATGLVDQEGDFNEVPDAIGLFNDRAVAAKPTFTLTDANRSSVAAVCQGLDGLPLAIEIVASRIRSFTPEQLNARLGDLLGLPAVSRTEGRHTSLETAINWSYQLLSTNEQTLLQRLSVFSGSFSLLAAEQACGFDPLSSERVIELLPGLIDKSLVASIDDGASYRYRLLESTRRFARSRLTDLDEVLDRLVDHLIDRGNGIDIAARTGRIGVTFVNLIKDVDLLRQSVEWLFERNDPRRVVELMGMWGYALALTPVRSDAADWIERALTARSTVTGPIRLHGLLALAALSSGESLPRAKAATKEALELSSNHSEESRQRALLMRASVLAAETGREEEALALANGTARYFEETGDDWRRAYSILAMAWTNRNETNLHSLDAAAAAFATAGDYALQAHVMFWKAKYVLNSNGSLHDAARYARESLRLAELSTFDAELAEAQIVLAEIAMRDERFSYVDAMAAQLIPTLKRSRSLDDLGRVYLLSGQVRAARGEQDKARAMFESALIHIRESGWTDTEAEALDLIASLESQGGRRSAR